MSKSPRKFFMVIIDGVICAIIVLLVLGAHNILGASPKTSDDMARTEAVLMPQIFDTHQQAAVHASLKYNQRSIDEGREYIGPIYMTPNGYQYSVAWGAKGSPTSMVAYGTAPGHRVVALWHTHGKLGTYTHFFSDQDMFTVNEKKIPLYMVDAKYTLRLLLPQNTDGIIFGNWFVGITRVFEGQVLIHDLLKINNMGD